MRLVATGMQRYDAGDYAGADRAFQDAFREGLRDRADRVQALKYSAFSLCLTGQQSRCRTQFQNLFELDPAFELSAVEAGHPAWQRAYAQARAAAKADRDHVRE